jgi:hypothetical protein
MKRLEVSSAVRHIYIYIYMTLGGKGLRLQCFDPSLSHRQAYSRTVNESHSSDSMSHILVTHSLFLCRPDDDQDLGQNIVASTNICYI